MGSSEAEDAGGLSPDKYDNEAAAHFNRRTLPFFKRVNYTSERRYGNGWTRLSGMLRNSRMVPPLYSFAAPVPRGWWSWN